LRILIVEDDAVLGFDLAEQLSEAGFTVVAHALNVAEALRTLSQEGCDFALLDVNLGQETSEAVAQALIERGTPFFTLTGYSADQCGAIFGSALSFRKPVDVSRLIKALQTYAKPEPVA
jgi:ActR/RegA family two-component response regulator